MRNCLSCSFCHRDSKLILLALNERRGKKIIQRRSYYTRESILVRGQIPYAVSLLLDHDDGFLATK